MIDHSSGASFSFGEAVVSQKIIGMIKKPINHASKNRESDLDPNGPKGYDTWIQTHV